jgi:hypothetical protein
MSAKRTGGTAQSIDQLWICTGPRPYIRVVYAAQTSATVHCRRASTNGNWLPCGKRTAHHLRCSPRSRLHPSHSQPSTVTR